MEHKNFERELPEGYVLAKYIDARKVGFGLMLNLIAFVVLLIVAAFNITLLILVKGEYISHSYDSFLLMAIGVTAGAILSVGYIVLHELVHGYAYKKKTGEKLTFGISWSCAYCGVPNIFVYRGAALFSVLAPLVFFGLLFALLTAVTLVIIGSSDNAAVLNALYAVYLALTVLQGLHLGGCSGDVYAAWLLCRRFKDERTLIRDTGPEQFFYVPSSDQAI